MKKEVKVGSLRRVLIVSLYITLAIRALNILINIGNGVTWSDELENFGVTYIYAFIITAFNAYYNDFISTKYSWELQGKKRLWYGAIGSIVVTLVGFGLARVLVNVGIYSNSFDDFLANETLENYVSTLIIAICISAILHAFHFYKALQDTRVKKQRIIAGTASARFDALKNQLDPHFLFNSLNVLTSLIEEDPHQAQKFTTSLSKVYRYVLEQKNKDLVTVDEELNFARTYVRLLKMRFEDSIVFNIPDTSSVPDAKIVPLSLQLLLENAVKHNVVTSSKPLHITVKEEGGMLMVTNNLQEKQVVKKSSGVGLQNIQQRYEILTDRQVHIEKTTSDFSVSIPMLTKKGSTVETQESHIAEKRYLKAKEKVDAVKGFYSNLITYCIVIPFLWWLNLKTTSFLWALFPTIGWGFGVLAHGMEAYGYNPLWGKRWEERKIQELMDKEDF
ncbi:2TM domain-containing protein [Flagellimonas sp. HMM57]|uniref:2TM domain-containing protein n=1 Tax=unclassified Flagellimonas TaxID=2644544 RepID=UPI0013D36ED5|nr:MULTISPECIES: 2TM domain-containing protein [unclassified Flagellimonas]UII75433.1 2TM domain-containing protein [Flagellimonas sp. HMM57]